MVVLQERVARDKDCKAHEVSVELAPAKSAAVGGRAKAMAALTGCRTCRPPDAAKTQHKKHTAGEQPMMGQRSWVMQARLARVHK